MKKYLLAAAVNAVALTAGAQWIPQNAGLIGDTLGFYEFSIPGSQTAWAVCYDGKVGLFANRSVLDFTRTTNGGATWVGGKMGTDTTLRFSNISAIDSNEAWVAMHKINFTTGGGVYHTTDGGASWTQTLTGQLFDNGSFPNAVHFKNGDTGIAIGDPNGGSFEVHYTTDHGVTWTRVPQGNIPPPLAAEYGWFDGYAAIGNTVWFGTSLGRMYKSTNFGKDWTVTTVDPAGKAVYEIAFSDDGLHGVTHLRDNNNITYLYTTSDGGATWTNKAQLTGWKSSRITAVPGTASFVATSVNGFGYGSSVSHDYGQTWSVIDNAVPKAACRFLNASTGWAGSFYTVTPPRPGIYKSSLTFPTTSIASEGGNPAAPGSVGNPDNLVTVFPMPAADVVNISFDERIAGLLHVIDILDLSGRVVESRKVSDKSVAISVSGLPRGTYTVRISSAGATIHKMITIAR